ncbi:MAG: hypothetical protein Q4A15_12080 [Prevotellaceae bacterium]|nr:hypothetical protein [Prevotellaceae bacterium]
MKKIYSTPSVKEIKLKLERMISISGVVGGSDDNDSQTGKEEEMDFGF